MRWSDILWWATITLAAAQGAIAWFEVVTDRRSEVLLQEVGPYVVVSSLGDVHYATHAADVARMVAEDAQVWVQERDGAGGYRLVQVVCEDGDVRTLVWPWVHVTADSDPAQTQR